jgi:hypothetical protein
MLTALDNLDEFKLLQGLTPEDDDTYIEEEIILLYIAIRLKPILTKFKLTRDKFDELCEQVIQNYNNENISIDYIINAVYNYINWNNKMPSGKLLTEDIQAFLEDYAEYDEEYYSTEKIK